MIPKIKKMMAVHAIGTLSLPVKNGPGLNFFWPHTTRQKMGIPHAKLLPATASEKSAVAAAGAIRHKRPSMAANKTHPQTVRRGMYPKRLEIGRKKLENGSAPSLENAQATFDEFLDEIAKRVKVCYLVLKPQHRLIPPS